MTRRKMYWKTGPWQWMWSPRTKRLTLTVDGMEPRFVARCETLDVALERSLEMTT